MKGLREKFRKNEGFTLVEMLIVVAIIAILIAVSIPMFSTTLEKARHGVDVANNRNAISLGTMEAMGSLNPKKEFETAKIYSYNVTDENHQGELTYPAGDGVPPQCTKVTGTDNGLKVKVEYKDGEIEVTTNWTIDATGGHVTVTPNFN